MATFLNKELFFRQVNSSCSNIINSIKHKMNTGVNETWKTKKLFSCSIVSMRLVEVGSVNKFNLPSVEEIVALNDQSSQIQNPQAIPPLFPNLSGLQPRDSQGLHLNNPNGIFRQIRVNRHPVLSNPTEKYDPIDSYTQFFKEKYNNIDVETSSAADVSSVSEKNQVIDWA